MHKLVINDLPQAKELDRQALLNVSGGFGYNRRGGGFSFIRLFRLIQRSQFGFSRQGNNNGGSVNFGSNNAFQGATTGINNGIQIFNFNFS